MRTFYTFISAVLFYVCQPVFALDCDISLVSNAGIANAETPTVDHVQAGTTIDLHAAPGCPSSFVATTDMCRVTMNIATSVSSSIYMEVWLPDNWEGRYISTGNSGLNGCVLYEDLQYLSRLQLAVGGANGGHAGDTGQYFANNIDVITDFSFRSVHNMTTIAKSLTETYYDFTPNKSYYYGCSTGGRQGLQSAQMFPEDFDGIIAVSPAIDFNGLTGWSGSFFVMTGTAGSSTFVTSDQWEAVAKAVMNKCDIIDGVADGIIEDPDLCTFDANTLLCREGSDTQTCLSNTQINTVSQVLGPLRDDENNLIYPALQHGAEAAAFTEYLNGSPNPNPTQWYENAIFYNEKYDPSKLNKSGIILGKTLDLATISSFSSDLSAFRNNGGKLITIHGLADPVITSTNSERYYKYVSAQMKLSPVELDDFFRYFRISGMGHCGFGPGAWEIGLTDSSVPNNAQQNVLFALFEWVEKGNAPDVLLGTKYNKDNIAKGISFQRNHCKYPYRTVYNGRIPTEPGSWGCHPIVDMNTPLEEDK